MLRTAAGLGIPPGTFEVIGIDGRVGSITPGKDADIAIFEGDPLRDIQARARQVLIDGVPQIKA